MAVNRETGIHTLQVQLTALYHRKSGVAPISLATSAQVVGPTYALTAAFTTRVGKCGYEVCTNSVANRPSKEFPRTARLVFVRGRGLFGWSVE